ncbi:MAG: hypothetical protein H6559_20815 [Lewinellaceae bacterium]|nr:hypothetical protein [Lewinellaceae bacterium]
MKKINYTLILLLAVFFSNCKKETTQADLCQGVICLNGGNCVNGDCNCPLQWTGSDCSQEKVPIKMKVGNIKITTFPPTTTSGAGWDIFDGPDVYIVISRNNTSEYESGFVEDLTGNYTWSSNFEFSDPTATYSISVYDYDDGLSTDDFMGGINFTPYRPGEKFPTSFTLDCGNCVVSFQFTDVTYFHS